MNQSNRVKLQVWLVILAVFGLGTVTGVSVDRLYLSRSGPRDARNGRGGFGRGPAHIAERMQTDLKLSDEQTAAVRKIFEESRKAFPPSRLFECPGFKEARQHTHDSILPLLTPEQQKLYEQREKEREERMKSGQPPPPPQ